MALSPDLNAIIELTDVQKTQIKDKLITIRDTFVPVDASPVCDTFYLTATYNKSNTLKINGNTCDMLLAPEQPTEGEPV